MGQAKAHEIKIVAIGLMALAVLGTLVALSAATALGGAVSDLGRAPAVGSAQDPQQVSG